MQIGDIVYLKSGSPAMTIVQKDGANWVVQWQRGMDLTTANIPELAMTVDDPRAVIAKTERERKEEIDPAPVVEARP